MTADLLLTVTNKAVLADNVVQLDIAADNGTHLPSWQPGAHVDLHFGQFTRSYSLCGDTTDRTRYRVAVLREHNGRGGSVYLHDHLSVGDRVGVSLPRNHFGLVAADHYIFLAGGIGVTPIVPMLASATAQGASWELHYGGRTRAAMAFLDELAPAGAVHIYPEDEVGLMPLVDVLTDVRPNTKIYCCGPPPLLDAAAGASAHWPHASLHTERFVPADLYGADNRAFKVILAQHGTTHQVPADRSILEVLEDAGIDVPTSCRVGTCGTCEAGVIDGVPEHRDSILTTDEQAEGRYVMLCVSRAATPTLTLDL